jgi:hypothetical protein
MLIFTTYDIGEKMNKEIKQCKWNFFSTYGTIIKAPSESQEDRVKLGIWSSMKIIIFASIYPQMAIF